MTWLTDFYAKKIKILVDMDSYLIFIAPSHAVKQGSTSIFSLQLILAYFHSDSSNMY